MGFWSTHLWATQELLQYWSSDLDDIHDKPGGYPDDAIAALQASTEAEVPEIRKGAFYELLRVPNFGQRDEAVGAPRVEHSDYNILTRARQHCAQAWLDVLLDPPRRSDICVELEKKSGKAVCASRNATQRSAKWNAIVLKENLRYHIVDPVAGFRALQSISIPMDEKNGFCLDCRQSWRNAWRAKLRQLWNELDEVLGLVPAKEVEVKEALAT